MKRLLFSVAILAAVVFSGVSPYTAGAQQPEFVRVFIDLPSRPTMTDRAVINNVGGDVRWQFATSNTISVEVPAAAVPFLTQFSGRFFNIRLEPTATITEDALDWGVDQINAEVVWGGAENAVNVASGANGGAGIKVGVIDTGLDRDHPDLVANIVGGWDFVDNESDFEDGHGHGTHVGGTIAAPDNGIGVIGVAPKASLYGLRVLNNSGSGSFGDIIAAVEWATGLNGGTKMDVVNMSLGCYYAPQPSACDDPALKAAIDAATNAGVLVVVAAGNSGSGTDTVGYPGQYASSFTVAATTSSNARASFSSTGPAVDIAAPGNSIQSTYIGGGYAYLSGTSMATPHVAGLAALVKGAHPTWTGSQVRAVIEQTATDLGTAGRDNEFGYGLINAVAAVAGTAPPPVNTAPFLSCTDQAAVTSSAGDNNGYEGSPANACTDGSGNATDTNSGTGTSTSCSNTGKDRHDFSSYNAAVNTGATINGIEIRLDAWAESTSSSPKLCVQLSWNGGVSWTTAKQTATITTSEATYILGSGTDTWGRTWSSTDFSNANFRVRVIDISSSTSRDFRLDWVALRVTSTGGTPPVTDQTAPQVTSTTPASNATGVATNTTVQAVFDEALQSSTVNGSTFTLTGPGGASVAGGVSYSSQTATFTPSTALASNTTYAALLTTGIKDSSGNALAAPVSWSFTTAIDSVPPTVLSTVPAANATGVAITTTVRVTFSEAINQATLTGNVELRDSGNNLVAGAITYASNVATFTPSANLANSMTYTLTLTTGIQDLAGNPLSQVTRSFTTAAVSSTPTPTPTPPPSGCAPVITSHSDTLPTGAGVVSFSWNAVPGTTSYRLRIQAAQGSTTYENVVILSSSTLSWTSPASGTGADKSFDATYRLEAYGAGTNCITIFNP